MLHISILEVVYYLVIERCPSEHHRDFIGPLWFVFPFVHLMVPKMQAAWISNQPVRELTPNLKRKRRDTLLSWPAQQVNTNVQMQHICCWRAELQWCKDNFNSSKSQFLEQEVAWKKSEKAQVCFGRTLQLKEATAQGKRPLEQHWLPCRREIQPAFQKQFNTN